MIDLTLTPQTQEALDNHEAFVVIPPEKLAAARRRHAWLIEIIDRAVKASESLPFYQRLKEAKTLDDFAWTLQLFHHSRTLTRFIGLALYNETDDEMMRFYAGHLKEEAPHSGWLQEWMCEQKLLKTPEEALAHPPLPATTACIEFGHRLARDYDRKGWLVGVNCGIEKCSHTFFSKVEPAVVKCLKESDHHHYFVVHKVADIYHSTEALVYVPELDPDSATGKELRDLALEGISLWCGMLNAWVGVDQVPRFGEDGRLE